MSEYANGTAAQNLQNFFNIIGSNNWGGTQTGTSTSTPSTWSTIGSALGMGASLFKLSDRRLKTDIRCIGAADNGLPIYTFRYINDPKGELHMGFMAQDVEKVRPEAVSKVGGVMAVNYELASK
ncbi:tail fiber domain-containing protein [Bradyrhizobium sp. KB893862 SZCCT0404]|nr:tail fiber domain-containing protein [Bradyrhizobium sp. KB893862 SZCCT0404]